MTSNRFTRIATERGRVRLLLLAAAAGILTLAVLAAFASSPRSSRQPPAAATPDPAPASIAADAAEPDPNVDLGDAEQVCTAFAAALFTPAAGDRSPRDAYRRAAAYATGQLAAAMVADQGRLPVSDQRPTTGVDVAAYVGDHMRPDTDGVAYRAVLVTLTDHDGSAALHVVYCTLQHEAPRWLVAGYELERSLP